MSDIVERLGGWQGDMPDALKVDLDKSAVEITTLRDALRGLELAEANYREAHDLHGDGSPQAGRAWDLLRRAGDKARTVLEQSPKD